MIYVVEELGNNRAICKCSVCNKDYLIKAKSDAKRNRLGEYCEDCKKFVRTMEITQENLRKAFNYSPETGELTHKFPGRKWNIGDSAVTTHNGGYYSMNIGGGCYLAHRIIFMYMKGYFPKMVNHINHNRKDNRWCNLREVNALDNTKNITLQQKFYY
jgi:hypothetical protein